MSDEQNSAEREAEEILRNAYAEARAEECPQGEDCPVHFRVDEEYFDKAMGYARMITYKGDFVVITEDNPQMDNPLVMIRALLGRPTPPRWSTSIFHVGSEGVISDLSDASMEVRQDACRYFALHDDWEAVRDQHNVTVTALEGEMIDVSKPWRKEN